MAIDLTEFFRVNLEAISDTTTDTKQLKLFTLTDTYKAPEGSNGNDILDYSPKQFRNEFLARRHLILVYQDSMIVLGMTAFEYAYIPSASGATSDYLNYTRSYLQYVDSTGLYEERKNQSHLTKSLVKCYFKYCKEVLNTTAIHLLACAKPAFLFAGSEFIESKRALPSTKLINWWIEVIKSTPTISQKDTNIFVYSPFEEADGSSRLKKRVNQLNESSGVAGPTWTYGLPFSGKQFVTDVVPLFEDDPKWRHYEATVLEDDDLIEADERKNSKRPRIVDSDDEENCADHQNESIESSKVKSKLTVKEFFDTIQVRPEFRSEASAFISIIFNNDQLKDEQLQLCSTSNSSLATFGCKIIGGLTFESVEAAKKASAKLSGWLKLMGVKSTDVKKVSSEEILKNENLNTMNNGNQKVENKMHVNSVQGLVKKKVSSAK